MLVNVPRLITDYHSEAPDPSVPEHRVAFGQSRAARDRQCNVSEAIFCIATAKIAFPRNEEFQSWQ
jgi:hypothetical protein